MARQPAERTNFTGIIVGVVMAALVALGGYSLFNNGKGAPPTTQEIDAELLKSRMGRVLKEHFREDYDTLLAQAAKTLTDKTKTIRELQLAIAHLAASVRVKHGNNAAYAPSSRLRQVLTTQAEVMRAVQAKYGASQCADLANYGVVGTTFDLKSLTHVVDPAAEAMMMAIAEGRDRPVTREPPTDEDYVPLNTAMEDRGLYEEDLLDTILNTTPDDSDCDHFIVMMTVAATLPGEGGDRVRAAFVKDLAATL